MKPTLIRNILIVATACLMMAAIPARAEEQAYGWQLMSDQERMEYRQKMRTMNAEERKAYRKEHHERMEERAKARGVTLPDEPGSGMSRKQGQGMKQGKGMGSGQGMKQGRGGGMGQGMGGGRNR